jgi:hypothetical protein
VTLPCGGGLRGTLPLPVNVVELVVVEFIADELNVDELVVLEYVVVVLVVLLTVIVVVTLELTIDDVAFGILWVEFFVTEVTARVVLLPWVVLIEGCWSACASAGVRERIETNRRRITNTFRLRGLDSIFLGHVQPVRYINVRRRTQ